MTFINTKTCTTCEKSEEINCARKSYFKKIETKQCIMGTEITTNLIHFEKKLYAKKQKRKKILCKNENALHFGKINMKIYQLFKNHLNNKPT